MTLMATETKTATTIAMQIADLSEELRSLPVDGLVDVLIALSRATTHIADFVAAAPAHYPHVTKRAADQIQNSAGLLEFAIDAELNPPADDA
ncbi:hypothetical protein [Nonomuraea sp. NPDC049129]|uniref:hypothetical protein n=1 Tax=Nonomuraea sp. NPDC049129 TaxID=3155272 RepID=UPI0033D2AA5A